MKRNLLRAVLFTAGMLLVGCAQIPTNTPIILDATPTTAPTITMAVVEVPTTKPTETVVPTETIAPTKEPVATPTETVAPTLVPTVEPTVEPTKEPTSTPTMEPTATPTEVPTSTPTPLPTETPTPTSTPTPTPTNTPTIKIGDYEIPAKAVTKDGYEYSWFDKGDQILRADNIGKDTYFVVYTNKYGVKQALVLCVESGKTIGAVKIEKDENVEKVSIPDIIARIIKSYLDSDFFYHSKDEVLANLNIYPSYIPTPTPIPNPEQPRLIATLKGGESVTYEFWDNHTIKITGTGATYDMNYADDFHSHWRDIVRGLDFDTIIVEEGITYLGSFSIDLYSMASIESSGRPEYLYLPSTLKAMHGTGNYSVCNLFVTGYKNGEKVEFHFNIDNDRPKKFAELLSVEIK